MRTITTTGYGSGPNYRLLQEYDESYGIHRAKRVLLPVNAKFDKCSIEFDPTTKAPYFYLYAGRVTSVLFSPNMIDPSLPADEVYQVKFSYDTAPDISVHWTYTEEELTQLVGVYKIFGSDYRLDPAHNRRPVKEYGVDLPRQFTESEWEGLPIYCDVDMYYDEKGTSLIGIKTSDAISFTDSISSDYQNVVVGPDPEHPYIAYPKYYDNTVPENVQEYYAPTSDVDVLTMADVQRRVNGTEAQAEDDIKALDRVFGSSENEKPVDVEKPFGDVDDVTARLGAAVREGMERAQDDAYFDRTMSEIDARFPEERNSDPFMDELNSLFDMDADDDVDRASDEDEIIKFDEFLKETDVAFAEPDESDVKSDFEADEDYDDDFLESYDLLYNEEKEAMKAAAQQNIERLKSMENANQAASQITDKPSRVDDILHGNSATPQVDAVIEGIKSEVNGVEVIGVPDAEDAGLV